MKMATNWLALLAIALAAALVNAADPGGGAPDAAARAAWPLWDGKESVADYAKRAGIKDVETTLDLGGGVTMKLTLIPAGKFIMGDFDERRETIEGVEVVVQAAGQGPYWARPDREVTISQPFYLGAYEVTQEQYEQVMGTNPKREERYQQKPGFQGKKFPEGMLSWLEAAQFCEQLSVKTGMGVWLPTEAQWEYACRAGSQTVFPWGDNRAEWKQYANTTLLKEGETLESATETSGFRGYAPVGSFKPNPWGLYDMLGNTEEWCHDWYTQNYLGAPTLDPAGPGVCPPETGGWCHVWRGGGYSSQYGPHGPRGRPLHHAFPRCGFRVVVAVAVKSTTPAAPGALVSWILGKGEHFHQAPAATAPAAPPPADLKLRVPPGCRAAPGTQAEPYAKSGWAQAIVHEATGMELVYIPAGSFLMGTPADTTPLKPQSERDHLAKFEKPHRVTLTQAFYLGKYEVTQAQWEQVMGSNPSLFKNAGRAAPVDTVSWDDCQSFCQKAGGGLRLPTEAEWEYACRAGTTGPYSGDLEDLGWYLGNSAGTTHPVGTRKPNAWGLYDLHGNVREWCQDYYATEYADEAVTDPTGPVKSTDRGRVVRGGAWASYALFCRSAARTGYSEATIGKGSGKQNLWEDAQADSAGDATVTLRSSGQRVAPYGLRPDFGCRFAITATDVP